MQYVVIRSGGKQYRVVAGDILEVDKISDGKKDVVFEDVLLFVNDGKVSIGKPLVNGVKVEGKLIENRKGDKIRVSKFKAKSRYRKTIGFRKELSVVKIEKITIEKDKDDKNTAKTAKKQTKTA